MTMFFPERKLSSVIYLLFWLWAWRKIQPLECSINSWWRRIHPLCFANFSACNEQGWLWNNFCLLGPSFKKFCDQIHLRSIYCKCYHSLWKMTDEKLCCKALAISHMQKYCSCFPQCFFGYNLHCQWMRDGNPKWIFFCEEIGAIAISYHPLKALSNFVNTVRFDAKRKKVRALLSKSLMGFLSKWNLQGAAAPVFFRFIQRQIQIVQYARIWIRKFERWN